MTHHADLEAAELERLIEAHQAAYEAYGHALDREDQAEQDAAMHAEIEALSAVCAYRCRTIEEAQRKAEYLVWHVETGNVSDEQMEAVLHSFLNRNLRQSS